MIRIIVSFIAIIAFSTVIGFFTSPLTGGIFCGTYMFTLVLAILLAPVILKNMGQ